MNREEEARLFWGDALQDGYIVAPQIELPEGFKFQQMSDYRPHTLYVRVSPSIYEPSRALGVAQGGKYLSFCLDYAYLGRAKLPQKSLWIPCRAAVAEIDSFYLSRVGGSIGGQIAHSGGDSRNDLRENLMKSWGIQDMNAMRSD